MSTDLAQGELRQGVSDLPDEQPFLGKEFALLNRYVLQRALVDTLGKTENHRHLIPRIEACHKSYRGWACHRNHTWATGIDSCSSRVCPHCARRRSLILGNRMEQFLMDRPKNTLRYIVLSERNCKKGELRAGQKLLWQAWTRLRRSVRWKRHFKGCMVAMETTSNAKDETWHPHLNVLVEGDYIAQEELRLAWIEATEGRGEQVWIGKADAGTVRELIKYVTKISDLIDRPAALDEFLTAVHRQRMLRTYGTFFGLKVDDEDSPRMACCPDCGSTEVVRLCMIKPEQVRMDEQGELRFTRPPRDNLADIRRAVQFNPSTPRRKPVNYMPALKKRWDKNGEWFRDRHAELVTAADRCRALDVDIAAGWDYSAWLAKISADRLDDAAALEKNGAGEIDRAAPGENQALAGLDPRESVGGQPDQQNAIPFQIG